MILIIFIDECKALMISSGFAVVATRTLSSAFEDIANLTLRVLVNLGLSSKQICTEIE